MDFVALDFETANSSRSSACSLGMAIVKNNCIVDKKYWLIHPEPEHYDSYNTYIHGITEKDTKDAPLFVEIWDELYPHLQDNMVVAHNAAFDISVIRSAMSFHNLPYGCFDYLCTYKLAQAALPSLASYRLDVLCDLFQIPLDHHNALDDACGCANVLLKLADLKSCDTPEELAFSLGICPGKCADYNYCACSYSAVQHEKDRLSKKMPLDVACMYRDDDFFEKHFVFTGTLHSMTRADAEMIVKAGGGIVDGSVKRTTNYLVCGVQDIRRLCGESLSSKTRKAQELRERGQDIQIIGEDDFVRLIDDELYQKVMLALG